MMSAPVPPSSPLPRTSAGGLQHLCAQGGAGLQIAIDARLSDAIELFRANPTLRLLPVIDRDGRPVGALLEEDVRALLYNPYGHSLLHNPAIDQSLADRIQPCPTADIALPLPDLLDLYARADWSEGMILTDRGRLCGVLTAAVLVRLAAERETAAAHARAERFDRLAASSDAFLGEVSTLADLLAAVAGRIEAAASSTADRAKVYTSRIAAVASASSRTSQSVIELAAQGNSLAAAIDQVRASTVNASDVAGHAVTLAGERARRGQSLRGAIGAIDATSAKIAAMTRHAHLLAINAAIEAARLGSDGDGFAVVARELRQFAEQTRTAAGEIRERISDIDSVSAELLGDHHALDRVTATIEGISRSVGAAVTAQAASARLLAENVDQAVQASGAIGANVAEIGQLVGKAAEGADDLRGLAGSLAAETRRLHDCVRAFVGAVRAAA